MKQPQPRQMILDGFPSCADFVSQLEGAEYGITREHACDGISCFNSAARKDFESRLIENQGLNLADLHRAIPVEIEETLVLTHKFDTGKPIRALRKEAVLGIPYWRIGGILSRNRALVRKFRERKGISDSQIMLLHGEGNDRNLEQLYLHSTKPGFFELFHALGSVVLIAPGYSVYPGGSQCRIWQPYNIARMARFCERANLSGLPCIPCISSGHSSDFERLVAWLKRQQEKVTHLSVNCQLLAKGELEVNLTFMGEIERRTGRSYKWLVFGPSNEQDIAAISEKGVSFCIVSGKPLFRGRAGRGLDQQGVLAELSTDDCIEINIERLKARIEKHVA